MHSLSRTGLAVQAAYLAPYFRNNAGMLISHRYQLIFVKTRKTAGTSIETSLSRFFAEEDVITPIAADDEAERRRLGIVPRNYHVPLSGYRPRDFVNLLRGRRRRYFNHIPARQIRAHLGNKIWNTYFKFCVERNPWDKVVSQYHYLNKDGEYRDLADFVARAALWSDYERYTIRDELAVDQVVRYENLQEELIEVCRRVGLPYDGWMPKAKGGFRQDRRHYTEVLGPAEQEHIRQRFAAEIDLLDYRFSD